MRNKYFVTLRFLITLLIGSFISSCFYILLCNGTIKGDLIQKTLVMFLISGFMVLILTLMPVMRIRKTKFYNLVKDTDKETLIKIIVNHHLYLYITDLVVMLLLTICIKISKLDLQSLTFYLIFYVIYLVFSMITSPADFIVFNKDYKNLIVGEAYYGITGQDCLTLLRKSNKYKN